MSSIHGQSRVTGAIGYTRRGKTKQTHNTLCVGHRYEERNTNKINKTRALLSLSIMQGVNINSETAQLIVYFPWLYDKYNR
jgi:hypothetical protein